MKNSEISIESSKVFGKLIDLIRTLRAENGCPWDRKQTPETMHPYILEEYHEMVQAINNGSKEEIVDEFGDLIFLVFLVAYMFEQSGVATLNEMMEAVIAKMMRRHPHVFGNVEVRDEDDVIDNWARIKASEENIRQRQSVLEGIPRSLPALNRAQKLARRAANVGFDWTRPEEVLPKVEEELNEFKQAVASGTQKGIREELGDLLFVIVNCARHLNINSEAALNETSDKFERRFRYIESELREQSKTPAEADLKEMDQLWDEAKALEKNSQTEESKE